MVMAPSPDVRHKSYDRRARADRFMAAPKKHTESTMWHTGKLLPFQHSEGKNARQAALLPPCAYAGTVMCTIFKQTTHFAVLLSL
jgi:hypothetical protein